MTTEATSVVRAWALEGGTLRMAGNALVLGGTGDYEIPVPSFLIQHPRGLVLFDTGLATEAADNVEAIYGDTGDAAQVIFAEHQRIDRNLERLGFSASEVTHVVLSHCHLDHTGGLHLFPHAQIFVGPGEVSWAYAANSPAFRAAYRTEDLTAADFHWNPVSGDFDLFADGSIRIVQTPGHTPGHLSLLIHLETGWLLLTGDATHLRCGLADMVPMPADCNARQAMDSLSRIRQLAAAHDAEVWVNHDPEDWQHYGAGPIVLGYRAN